MQKVLVKTKEDWTKLVARWIAGIGSTCPLERSTDKLETLKEMLRTNLTWDEKMSINTLKFATALANSATMRPPTYPCMVVAHFHYEDAFPAYGQMFTYYGLTFITPEDFEN